MRIAKHNAHGMQLLVELTPGEALALAVKLIETARVAQGNLDNYYFSTPCGFEDDNDRWVATDFDIVIGHNNLDAKCLPTYPCGKDIALSGMNSAPEFCNLQVGHEDICYRR